MIRALVLMAAGLVATAITLPPALTQAPTEAPAAFDAHMNLVTNGVSTQTQFDLDRMAFEERESNADGLGPVYNGQSCVECHQNPVSGAGSQIMELRAGRFDGGRFVDHPGGSLINDRATDPAYQERVLPGYDVQTFRISLSILGDGFVEALDSNAIAANASRQSPSMRGNFIQVPVAEAGGLTRDGRFGWKNQHASLVSFAADAYLNEMGITSPLQPTDNTSLGRTVVGGVTVNDNVPDPEDNGDDIEAFARFMRSLGVPPRDAALAADRSTQLGSALFDQVGCTSCHVRNFTTLPTGTVINRGAFTLPAALGNKVIHPFGDYLLHDVGTGDGIVQNGGPSTRLQVRTAPLWGLRARTRLMHDGLSVTPHDAILRHAGQATPIVNNYRGLGSAQKAQLQSFLNSL